MTRTEYREYIASEYWQHRRKEYLRSHNECENCHMCRRTSLRHYDQDLHVHHVSYARVGSELDQDLKALCKRCHEIETFGNSDLKEFGNGTLSSRLFFWLEFLDEIYPDYEVSPKEQIAMLEQFVGEGKAKTCRDVDLVFSYLLRNRPRYPTTEDAKAAWEIVERQQYGDFK